MKKLTAQGVIKEATMVAQAAAKKKGRLVRCNGKLGRGAWKGQRCNRTKRLIVDKSDNTRMWWCKSHEGQRSA